MEVLNSNTLIKALRTCDEYDGARIGVACASEKTAKTFIDSLWSEITTGRMPGWEIGREAFHGHHAQLKKRGKNDYSTIEIFPAVSENNIHGRSYHQVLYERYLDNALVMELAWCERLSFDSDEPDEPDGRGVLDEFLNSFKIV